MNRNIDREQILGDLLRNVGPDKPSRGFTSVVMEEVVEEAASKSELTLLLRSQALEKPSSDFERRLAVQLAARPQPIVRPVIGNKTWIAIAAFLVITIVLVISQDDLSPSSGAAPFLVTVGMTLHQILSGIPVPYLVTTFALAILLFADYLLTRRRLVD
jgi:hypothetical protein